MRTAVLVLVALLLGGGCGLPEGSTLCDYMVASGQAKGPCFTPAQRADIEKWKAENERRWREAHPNVKPTDPQ